MKLIAPLDIYLPNVLIISLKLSDKVFCKGPKFISYSKDISLIKVIILLNRLPNCSKSKGKTINNTTDIRKTTNKRTINKLIFLGILYFSNNLTNGYKA